MRIVAMMFITMFSGIVCSVVVTLHTMDLSVETRNKYFNPDGSCVQLSIGIAGVHSNVPVAARLPFDSEYGKGIRGGSGPDRVAAYCDKRKIPAWNVTGEQTIRWIEYGARTGRFPAIGLGTRHFQTLYGWDEKSDTFYVCNNQTPNKIDAYTRKQFLKLHHDSGEWIVMLKQSGSDTPVITNWLADSK